LSEDEDTKQVLVFGGTRKMMRTSAHYILKINHNSNII